MACRIDASVGVRAVAMIDEAEALARAGAAPPLAHEPRGPAPPDPGAHAGGVPIQSRPPLMEELAAAVGLQVQVHRESTPDCTSARVGLQRTVVVMGVSGG